LQKLLGRASLRLQAFASIFRVFHRGSLPPTGYCPGLACSGDNAALRSGLFLALFSLASSGKHGDCSFLSRGFLFKPQVSARNVNPSLSCPAAAKLVGVRPPERFRALTHQGQALCLSGLVDPSNPPAQYFLVTSGFPPFEIFDRFCPRILRRQSANAFHKPPKPAAIFRWLDLIFSVGP